MGSCKLIVHKYGTKNDIICDANSVDELKKIDPINITYSSDINFSFIDILIVMSNFKSYDELKEYISELTRIFNKENTSVIIGRVIRGQFSNSLSFINTIILLKFVFKLIDDDMLDNNRLERFLLGNKKYQLCKEYDNMTNIGKIIIEIILESTDYKYRDNSLFINEDILVRYISLVKLYETEEEFNNDKIIHDAIFESAFSDGTKSFKKQFTLKKTNSGITRMNKEISMALLKHVFKLADEYGFNKRQINILYKYMTGSRYVEGDNIFNVYTGIPRIYDSSNENDDKIKFFKDISEVNKKAEAIYAELLVEY